MKKNYNVTKQIIELTLVAEINWLRIMCLLGGPEETRYGTRQGRPVRALCYA